MYKLNSKLLTAGALSALLMVGCGGGSSGGTAVSTDISQSISALITFMNTLIADSSDTGEPVDINSLTLATDDSAEATPIN